MRAVPRCGARTRTVLSAPVNRRLARILHARSLIALALTASCSAYAQPLLPPGDVALRHDLQLLADAGVLGSPQSTWPIPWPDLQREVASAATERLEPATLDALARVRDAARRASAVGLRPLTFRVAAAERPPELRSFANTPREDAEAATAITWLGDRAAAHIAVTAVPDPEDSKDVRLDGSYVGLTLGNWILTGGWIERWWGPGWEGSLILSNNARPVPGVALDRNYSDAFRTPLLRWIGAWRASLAMSQLEGSDVAVPDAWLFAARVALRPRPWLEIGISRTAQWCGEGRPCDAAAFGDLLLGRDNRGGSLPADQEPGNQMAGYDLRARSPWDSIPAAAYVQLIGEDEAGGLPSKFLGLAGMELWGSTRWGSHRLVAEYADTACNFSRSVQEFDCAYRNSLYPQGYTFRGRTLGHALGGDGRMSSVGATLVRRNGASWSVRARRIRLNRGGDEPETAHPLAATQEEFTNLELQYNRAFASGELGIGLGLTEEGRPFRDGSDFNGFVQWRQGY